MVRILSPWRRHRAVAVAAVTGLAAISLAACGGGGAAGNGGSATSGNIKWWGWTPEINVANNDYIKAFNKVYPNIHVTYKQLTISGWDAGLRPALASSVGPDVFDIAPGAGMQQYAQYAQDLTPAVKKALGATWKSKVAPIGIRSLSTSSGKLAAMSVGATFAGSLWINQDLFDKYHLTAPTNMAQWVNVCKTFKQNGVGCFVQGAGQTAFNQDTLQSIADEIQPGYWTKASKGQAKWTDPTMVKALTIWKQLFHNGIMEKGALGVQQYPDANNDFLSGKNAMVMMGTWYMQYSTQSGMTSAISAAGVGNPKPFNAIAIPFPDVAGTGRTGTMYGDSDYGIAVNAKSKARNAATTFVTWLTTSKAGQQEVANALNDIPALNGVQPQWDNVTLVNKSAQQSALEKLVQQTTTSSEPRLSLITSDLQQAIGVASTTVAEGQKTPEQAASALQDAADKLPNKGTTTY